MKKLAFLLPALFLISCGNNSEFSSLDEEALNQKIIGLQNNNETEKIIEGINVFVDKYPESKKTADYLRTLATIYANEKKNFNQAITLYKKIINKYPESKVAPDAYFSLGFIYSNELKDYNNAKVYYTEFINKFPNHEAVESAKFELQYLGKSEDEILNILQNNVSGN
jgi:TolA-binding protein